MLHFTILGIPFAKQSCRFTKAGVKYQPAKIKNAENSVRHQVLSQLPAGFEPWSGPISVKRMSFVFPPLKSFSQAKLKALALGAFIPKDTKPDLTDNLQKGIFDSLQGIVYLNDSQICQMHDVQKCYGLTPRIEIELEKLEL